VENNVNSWPVIISSQVVNDSLEKNKDLEIKVKNSFSKNIYIFFFFFFVFVLYYILKLLYKYNNKLLKIINDLFIYIIIIIWIIIILGYYNFGSLLY